MNDVVNGKSDSAEADSKIKQKKIEEAQMYINPFSHAALAIGSLHGSRIDVPTVMKELSNSADKICDNSLREVEELLMTQAKTLNYVFNDALSKLADLNMTNQIQLFTDIAFRSQNQCRKTLTALAEIKHPKRTTFIQKQNTAIQVNNGVKSIPEKNENKEKVAIELMENENEQWLDRREKEEAIATHSQMAPMEVSRC
jgi:hypothetical protein